MAGGGVGLHEPLKSPLATLVVFRSPYSWNLPNHYKAFGPKARHVGVCKRNFGSRQVDGWRLSCSMGS